jgi:hypothetical protein
MLIARKQIATAAWLRFQKRLNIPELVADRGAINSPERTANIQPPFVLQHLCGISRKSINDFI